MTGPVRPVHRPRPRGRGGDPPAPLRPAVLLPAVLVLVAALVAGCGGSGRSQQAAGAGDPVDVLYAGSLVNLMEHGVGPAFSAASGHDFRGYAAGSAKLANEITGEVRRGDVFISASPSVNDRLMAASGGWESWYAVFATAPLVIAYNPHSRFADAFAHRPWWQVLTSPGIRVGRTDPRLDPKGRFTTAALAQAQRVFSQPGLAQRITEHTQVFPEEELLGRLESGQLDAGFFYANEAQEHSLPTVRLGRVDEHATYTVTVLTKAEHPAAGVAFVRFLLGPSGQALLKRHGLTVTAPAVHGDRGAVPAGLQAAFADSG